jgi:hypothetical protein
MVANRGDKRMRSEVLDHDPTHDDSTAFFERLKTALAQRDLLLQGLTTDGSPRYPEPIRTVLGEVPQHICPFHVLKALPQGLRCAVAAERHRLAQSKPQLQRGRPSSKEKTARRLARQSQPMQDKISGVLQGRFFLVKRRRKPSERKKLLQITPG